MAEEARDLQQSRSKSKAMLLHPKSTLHKGKSMLAVSLRHMVDLDDEQLEAMGATFSEAEARALSSLGTTIYGLLVSYVQLTSIISAHPAAEFWTTTWLFGWLRFFSVDFFRFLEVPHDPGLTIQLKLLFGLMPVCVLFYLYEYFWRDHAEWRHRYVDEWKLTRRHLSATHLLTPAFPAAVSAVTACCAVMVVATPVTISTALFVAVAFFVAQTCLGELVVFFIKIARVVYCELKHNDTVDERGDFFYNVRVQCQHVAVILLNMWYLPLSVGLFSCVDLVRQSIRVGRLYVREDAAGTGAAGTTLSDGIHSNVHDGEIANLTVGGLGQLQSLNSPGTFSDADTIDTILLVLISMQVFTIAFGFAVGFPILIHHEVGRHMKRYTWHTYSRLGAEHAGDDDAVSGEKGQWIWNNEDVGTPKSEGRTLFELGDRVRKMEQIYDQLTWAEKHGHRELLERLPAFIKRKLLPSPHVASRVEAVRNAMAKTRAEAEAQWQAGMWDYQRRNQAEKGLDALWMCSRNGWTRWKVSSMFVEKGLMYLFASGLASSLWAPTRCALNPAESSGRDDGSGTGGSLAKDDLCSKGSAIGMCVIACATLAAEVYARPYLNRQEDVVEGMCRFATVCMTVALNVIEFDVLGGTDGSFYLLLVLLVLPPCLAIGYSIYVLDPHLLAKHLLNEVRLFWHKRKAAKQQQSELEEQFNREVYSACRIGNLPLLSYLLTKHDEDLDLNWANDGADEVEEAGFSAFHVAAARGNVGCLEELLQQGLFAFDQQKHAKVLSPLQLAWKNGCGRCVSLLEELQFEMLTPPGGEVDIMEDSLLRTDGLDLLHGNIVSALISAGHHPERGSDMEWILNHQGNYDQTVETVALGPKTAVKMVFASLVLEHQWEGLAALAAAIELSVLELWDDWVNHQVITAIVRAAPGIKCLKIDGANLAKQDLQIVAQSPEFSNTCVVFHGTPEDRDLDTRIGERKAKNASDLVMKFAYGETSWSLAGVSRLLRYLRADEDTQKHVESLLGDLHDLDVPGELDFQPPMRERTPGGRQYRSHRFQSDESDDPHQWVLVLEVWGGQLAVLIQYVGRFSGASPSHVTASFTVTCTAEKQLLYPGAQIRISLTEFHRGENLHVGTFRVDATTAPSDLVELRVFDIFVMETTMLAIDCVDWRITGLNRMIDTGTTEFSDIFKATGARVPWQMGLHIPERTLAPEALFNVDEAYFQRAGVQLPLSSEDETLETAIAQAFKEFVEDEASLAMRFPVSFDSTTRKLCYLTASEMSLDTSSQTDESSGLRSVVVYKPDRQDDTTIDVFIRACDSVARQPSQEGGNCCVVLRIEHESDRLDAAQCLGHLWMDANDIWSPVGCPLANRTDLLRSDRSECIHVKAVFVPGATCRPTLSLGQPWTPDDREKAWLMDVLREQATHTYTNLKSASRKLLIAPDHIRMSEDLLAMMLPTVELCEAKKGTVLLEDDMLCDEFLVLLSGSCLVGDAQREEAGQVALSRLCDMLLAFGQRNQQRIVAKTKVKYLRIDAAAVLRARLFAASTVPSFPAPAFHTLACVETVGETTSSWEWSLQRPAELLPLGSFASLTSDCFSIPQTTNARWRLHLVPVRKEGTLSAGDRGIALYLGCDRAGKMSTTQRMRAKFTTSLVVDDGTTKQLQSTGLRSQQAQDDPDLQLVQLVLDPSPALLSLDGRARMVSGDETTPGGKAKERASEWLSGGVEIGRSDLTSEESVTLKLELVVPTHRQAQVHARFHGAARGFMVTGAAASTSAAKWGGGGGGGSGGSSSPRGSMLTRGVAERLKSLHSGSSNGQSPTHGRMRRGSIAKATPTFDIEEQQNPLAEEDQDEEAVQPL